MTACCPGGVADVNIYSRLEGTAKWLATGLENQRGVTAWGSIPLPSVIMGKQKLRKAPTGRRKLGSKKRRAIRKRKHKK